MGTGLLTSSDPRDVTLGRYRLLALLGQGGMADVYLACTQGRGGFQKLLVVKIARFSGDAMLSTMFLDEARLAGRLSHPNIVQTYEIGEDGTRDYIVMEYLDGANFSRLRLRAKEAGGIPLRMSLTILTEVLEGLEYAHGARGIDGQPLAVVHRDLTPSNVMVTAQGEVKILDFGIAKAADNHSFTQTGRYTGKLDYMPPEQLRGERVDARADIFSESSSPSRCQDQVCVESGLGPEGCFFGTPTTQDEFLNACSTAKTQSYDNCEHLGLCSGSTSLPATVDPSNPTIPTPITNTPAPSGACRDIAGPSGFPNNIIFMYGANAFEPLFKALQPTLSVASPPYRAVFMSASACNGAASQFDDAMHLMKDPATSPTAQWAHFYDDSGTLVDCTVDAGGTPIDVGVSSVFPTSCNSAFVPGTTVVDYIGPVIPLAFTVPATSSEQSISAEAAHMVFGLGGQPGGGLKAPAPWTDVNYYFIRSSSSVSTIVPALVIDVPKGKFWGVDRVSNENLRDSMLTTSDANKSIGILQIDYVDKNRSNLRSLFLQAKGQLTGYLPDSEANLSDKANVRDGHYPMWAYLHFLAQLGPGGVPSQAAQAFALHFNVQVLEQALLDQIIAASAIPQCAMRVHRSNELGDLEPTTGIQCDCYFEAKTGKPSAACQTCQTSADCPSDRSTCNYGYCEPN